MNLPWRGIGSSYWYQSYSFAFVIPVRFCRQVYLLEADFKSDLGGFLSLGRSQENYLWEGTTLIIQIDSGAIKSMIRT